MRGRKPGKEDCRPFSTCHVSSFIFFRLGSHNQIINILRAADRPLLARDIDAAVEMSSDGPSATIVLLARMW